MRNLKTYSYELKSRSSFKNTYELFEKAMYDEISALENAEKKGLEQGAKQEKIEIAKNLILSNVPIDVIVKSTGLSENEIEKLK